MLDKPMVIVFDIDGTLIGDIRPQVMMYELQMALKTSQKRTNIINSKEFQDSLNAGIVRPYFVKFIKKLKETFPNVELFVYTASEKQWAHFLVPHIEKACGCRFNRPLMTRDNCLLFQNEYRKHMSVIQKCIAKSLKKKYGMLKTQDLNDRILIIDNNTNVYDQNDKKHVVFCPTYDYKRPINVPAMINERTFRAIGPVVTSVLSKYMNMPNTIDYVEFQKAFYSQYLHQLANVQKNNEMHSRDKFFLYLMNIIVYKKIQRFTPKAVSYISKKLESKQQSTPR